MGEKGYKSGGGVRFSPLKQRACICICMGQSSLGWCHVHLQTTATIIAETLLELEGWAGWRKCRLGGGVEMYCKIPQDKVRLSGVTGFTEEAVLGSLVGSL